MRTSAAFRDGFRAGLAVLLVGLLTTWPMVTAPVSRLLGRPDLEAAQHLWTLWAASRDGPLVIDTELASYPFGYRGVLADPLNLVFFAPGTAVSPVLGYHLVGLGNLALAGLTAVVAGRVLLPGGQPPAWATASLAAAAVPLAGSLVTGMTEALTLWLAVLAPVLVVQAVLSGGRPVPVAAVVAGACAWGGAYTMLYGAMLAGLLLALDARSLWRAPGAATARLAVIAAGAALLAAPVLWAILTQRPEGLPGTVGFLDKVLGFPEGAPHRVLGADLLSVFLPWRMEIGGMPQATYLGAVVGLLAVVGLVERRAWRLALAAAACVLFGLGTYLQVGGTVPRMGGQPVLLPAGLLTRLVPLLGRAARWHRLLALAALLMAPLAAAGAVWVARLAPVRLHRPVTVLLVAAAVGDLVLLAPLSWPRPTLDASLPAIYASLPERGPIIVVPRGTRAEAAGSAAPSRVLLWQALHGMPIAERPMFAGTQPRLRSLRQSLEDAAREGDGNRARVVRKALRDLGYAWIVHHEEPGTPVGAASLIAVLGDPDVVAGDGSAWRP